MNLEIEYKSLSDLIPYARNSRTHSDAQIKQLASSIREFGFVNPILISAGNDIVAGHGRALAAEKLGLDLVPTITLGHLSDTQRRAYVIADNRLAENASWDIEMLKLEIDDLSLAGFELDLLGFEDFNNIEEELADNRKLENLIEGNLDDDDDNPKDQDNPYSSKIEVPIYEPNREKPHVNEVYNVEKFNQLIDNINNAQHLTNEEKLFLVFAAHRHIVFNYEKIADYYAHSEPKTKDLFERSALVIIDYEKAIENGFVKLTSRLQNITINPDEVEELIEND